MKNDLYKLPKGGVLLKNDGLIIQLGVPPETIKDSINVVGEVPDRFILPKQLFSSSRLCSFAELEFPVYFNYFLKKKKTVVYCKKDQIEVIQEILRESIFGPDDLNIELEYANGKNAKNYPDMEKELRFFATNPSTGNLMSMNDFVEFVELDSGKKIDLCESKTLSYNEDTGVVTIDCISYEVNLDIDIDIEIQSVEPEADSFLFIPPVFGITTLGASHGFDPKGKTSGFIFWINGSGIMIDPPIDSSLWLYDENVDPCMVKSVILTHCHADHDSGVMQKILQEGRIKLYTTPTILRSFIKKTSLLTGLSSDDLFQLIDFVPIQIGRPILINGAQFVFSYRLHAIPTIGFELSFKGKNIVYTSDHLNDKKYFKELLDKNILTPGRFEELYEFDWNKDLIIHEAGVPPIHTPLDTLLKLENSIKQNILLVHVDKSIIPAESGFKETMTGLKNTLIIDVSYYSNLESIQILNFLSGIDIFENLNFRKAAEFLSVMKYRKFSKDECLIKEGEESKRFFILLSGRASLYENGDFKAYLVSGSYFGEASIVWDRPSIDTIVANTDIITLTVEKDDFLSFLMDTSLLNDLKKLDVIRKHNSFETISKNTLFNSMTITQKNHLEYLMEFCESESGTVLMTCNNPVDYAIIWQSGEAEITDSDDNAIETLSEGDYIGSPAHLIQDELPDINIVCVSKCTYFKIKWDNMMRFLKKNPRILMELRNSDHFYND